LNKIASTKTTSAIFLAIVLVAGTIAISSPSFMIGAKAQPYYGTDNRYNSYGPIQYPDNNYYNSYEPRDYGMDSYDDRNSYDNKPYGNDNSYKLQYTSYDGKDDKRDKSKDSSKSVNINKLKCINTNLNINGNNAGNISIGNKAAEGGYLGAYSSGGGGYDGYKKDKGFTCIINNNNTNVNTVGGNVTDGNGDVTDTCEECFLDALGPTGLQDLIDYLGTLVPPAATNLEDYCALIQSQITGGITPEQLAININFDLVGAGITLDDAELDALVACLFDVLGG
jgi:hypothetical protein